MQNLAQKKAELQEMIIDSLGDTIIALKEWLPRQAVKFNSLLLIEAQLKELNVQKIRGVIDHGSYQLELNQIREALLGFISDLEEADFDTDAAPSQFSYKKGSVLYRIPHRMQIKQKSKCQVRIAFDVDTLLENIELTEEVRVQDIRISDYMTVELIEPPESEKAFDIFALHDTGQFIDKDSFTEWIFYVTPLLEGKYPLVFKVSIVEIIDNKERKRNLVLEETVEVVAMASDAEEVDFKASDYSIQLTDNSGSENLKKTAKVTELFDMVLEPSLPTSPAPEPIIDVKPSKSRGSSLKTMSRILGVLLVLVVGTWTFSTLSNQGERSTETIDPMVLPNDKNNTDPTKSDLDLPDEERKLKQKKPIFNLPDEEQYVQTKPEAGRPNEQEKLDQIERKPDQPATTERNVGHAKLAPKLPVVYSYKNAPEVMKGNGANALLAKLNRMTSDQKLLEITGIYYQDEKMPEGFENMGMARAIDFRDMLMDSGEVKKEQFVLKSKKVSRRVPDEAFEAVRYRLVTKKQ